PPVPPPVIASSKRSFSRAELVALSEGRVSECLGEAYREADSHDRTPTLSRGNLLLLDAVTEIDLGGGPWKRGYLAAESQVSAGDWFFPAHFRNDPCMPGSLVFEACVQAMRFDLLYRGYSLSRPGYHFEPVPGSGCKIQCRGQVSPGSRRLKIEIFVKTVGLRPYPYIQADAQVHCDGLKLFRMDDLALRLAPETP
ncbi:MAG TPA: hypothetical protein VFW62_02740, partial [bacterium]|nr:hypothetical protein [bacterium]